MNKPTRTATVQQLRAVSEEILNLLTCLPGANPYVIDAARTRLEVVLTGVPTPQPVPPPLMVDRPLYDPLLARIADNGE